MIVAALVIPLLGKPLMLLPVQLLLLQLVLQPVVSLVFEADPPDADIMTRPPPTRVSGSSGTSSSNRSCSDWRSRSQ